MTYLGYLAESLSYVGFEIRKLLEQRSVDADVDNILVLSNAVCGF